MGIKNLVSWATISYFGVALLGIAITLAYMLPGSYLIDTKQNLGILSHILFSILSFSLMLLAALQAILVWLQNYILKSKKYSSFLKIFPPLQTTEAILFPILWAGLILLTLSLVTGFIFVNQFFSNILIPKILLSIISWIIIFSLIIGNYLFGWRGFTAAKLTLIGMTMLALAYFGTKIFMG